MPPGKGSRFVGVAEEYLRHKAIKLEERMRSLEDALAILQVNTSTRPHPLLTKIWSTEEADVESGADSTAPTADSNLHGMVDALVGSLHFDGDLQSGSTCFFGPSGGAEVEKQVISDTPPPSIDPQEIEVDYLLPHISKLDQAFPFTPPGLAKEQIRETIKSYLPNIQRAVSLCETFLKSLSWIFRIVSRQQIVDHLIPLIYRPGLKPLERPCYSPHDLALLFSVLAVGALVDPALPQYNAEARHYHRLARAALCLQSVFLERSMATLQALHLMSVYYGMSGIESNAELCYSFLNLAAQAALQPGTGRPPVIMPAVVDCQIPSDLDEATYQSGEVPITFGTWSSRYARECLAPVVEVTQAVKPPNYQTILELDRKIRDFSMPGFSDSPHFERAFAQSSYRELTLMYLHRGFFAQAMGDFPLDPLRSPVGRSFMVAYQCASALVTVTMNQYKQQPVLCSRVWRIWSHTFSAAVIVGTVAIRRLGINLDPDPFEHLEEVCSLYHSAAQTCSRAKKALPVLLRLHQKAVRARIDPLQHTPSSKSPESDDEPNELEVFGGRTLLLGSSVATQNNPPNQRNHYQSHLINIPEVQNYTLGERAVEPPELELLHREVSGPLYYRPPCAPPLYGPQQGQQGDLILEDKWSSFVYDASLPPGYFSHLGPQAR
ncbi:hypothetical protein BDR07DRAFT_1449403 [Suillus spraguei]|nr:hypothetical protein BDR07DRAFT_1449403 [Suillus spraguei]